MAVKSAELHYVIAYNYNYKNVRIPELGEVLTTKKDDGTCNVR